RSRNVRERPKGRSREAWRAVTREFARRIASSGAYPVWCQPERLERQHRCFVSRRNTRTRVTTLFFRKRLCFRGNDYVFGETTLFLRERLCFRRTICCASKTKSFPLATIEQEHT